VTLNLFSIICAWLSSVFFAFSIGIFFALRGFKKHWTGVKLAVDESVRINRELLAANARLVQEANWPTLPGGAAPGPTDPQH